MKYLVYFLFNFFFLTHFAFENSLKAQEDDQESEVTITIKKDINGEVSESTTSFSLDDVDLDQVLEQLESDMKKLEESMEKLDDDKNNMDLDIEIKIEGVEDIIKDIHDERGSYHKQIRIIEMDEKSDKGFLGIVPVSSENGVSIEKVIEGSAAEEAGLQIGDVITSIDKYSIESPADVYKVLGETSRGDKMKISYLRNGKKHTAKAVLNEFPAVHLKHQCMPKPFCVKSIDHGFLGIYMDKGEEGIKIKKVIQGSAADHAGLLEGDILKTINGSQLSGIDDVMGILKETKAGDVIEIGLLREEERLLVKATLKMAENMKRHDIPWTRQLERPFLGVSLTNEEGTNVVKVLKVIDKSPAETAGMEDGDIIRSLDNIQLNSVEDLILQIRSKRIGEEVELIIDRNSDIVNIMAKLGSKVFSHCGNDFNIEQGMERKVYQNNIDKQLEFGIDDTEEIIEDAGENSDNDEVETEKVTSPGDNYQKLNVNNLVFYPNPNNGKFNLKFSLENEADTEVMILDNQGKEVYSEYLEDFSGAFDKTIDISESSSGTYIMQIKQGGKVLNERVIIQ